MPKGNLPRVPACHESRAPRASDPSSQLISVVVPAKDEARFIGSLITKIMDSLDGTSHEIIIVDDGSRDKTAEIARSAGTIVVSHEKNLGKGAAMQSGVRNASGEIIVFLDSDGAHDPQDILKVVAPILEGRADLVIGSRVLPQSRVSVAPFARRISNDLASFTISIIVSFLLPLATLLRCPVKYVKITDCTSGFRAIRKGSWQELSLFSQGFQIETEMIYEAARHKLTIAEVPISCNWSTQFSHLSILRDGTKTLKLLVRKLVGNIGRR